MIILVHLLYELLFERIVMYGFGRGRGYGRGRGGLTDEPRIASVPSFASSLQQSTQRSTQQSTQQSTQRSTQQSTQRSTQRSTQQSTHPAMQSLQTKNSAPAPRAYGPPMDSDDSDEEFCFFSDKPPKRQLNTNTYQAGPAITPHTSKGGIPPNTGQISVRPKLGQPRTVTVNPTSIKPSAGLPSQKKSYGPGDSTVNPSFLANMAQGGVTTTQSEWGKPFVESAESVAHNKQWLTKIEKVWTDNKKNQVELHRLIRECYDSAVNPFTTALYLLKHAPGFCTGKTNTLSHLVIREFERWTKEKKGEYDHLLDRYIRYHAFTQGLKGQMTNFDLIVKSFKLNHPGNEYFTKDIKMFLESKRYKEACTCAAKLELQHCFDIKDIIWPLLLQDKVNMVEMYVYQNYTQQMALLRLLDHLCDDTTNIDQLVRESQDVPGIKKEKLQRKVISKLAIRLMKLYQIPQSECPNVDNRRSLGGLRYIVYSHYVKKDVAADTWDELVQTTVGDNEWLQEQLLDVLVDYLDMTEAAKWALHYRIPQDKIPHQVLSVLQSDAQIPDVGALEAWDPDAEEDWDDDLDSVNNDKYHALALDSSCIHFVDTKEGFIECVRFLCKEGTMLGIDAEWKPLFGQTNIDRMALLQLATFERIFLLDIIQLKDLLSDHDWITMATSIFVSSDVLKLGFGIDTDIKMLVKSIPVIKQTMAQTSRLVDLLSLKIQLLRVHPDFFDDKPEGATAGKSSVDHGSDTKVNKTEEKGLSEFVRQMLGRPLNKSQQMSNWERRPLRPAQVHYAALDAYVLLEVYQAVKLKVEKQNIYINLEPPVTVKTSGSKKSRRERLQQRVAEKPKPDVDISDRSSESGRPVGPPISPQDLAVVVDTMLQGLGRHLRCCGIDVYILDNNEDHYAAVEIALREKRVILTSGQPYQELRGQVPEGWCYHVAPGLARDQATDVLHYFNVKVTQKDIFSRCQLCNGEDILQISREEIRRTCQQNKYMSLHKTEAFQPTYAFDDNDVLSNEELDDEDLQISSNVQGIPASCEDSYTESKSQELSMDVASIDKHQEGSAQNYNSLILKVGRKCPVRYQDPQSSKVPAGPECLAVTSDYKMARVEQRCLAGFENSKILKTDQKCSSGYDNCGVLKLSEDSLFSKRGQGFPAKNKDSLMLKVGRGCLPSNFDELRMIGIGRGCPLRPTKVGQLAKVGYSDSLNSNGHGHQFDDNVGDTFFSNWNRENISHKKSNILKNHLESLMNLEIDKVPENAYESGRVQVFYGCTSCGKVLWNGARAFIPYTEMACTLGIRMAV